MATETCVYCGEECTPWYWIHSKQGHACQDCGKMSKMSDSELTEDQVKKALEISLDGATPEEVEVIRETQEAKGRGHLFKELVEDQAEVIEFEPIQSVSGEVYDDIREAQEKIFKACSVPAHLIDPNDLMTKQCQALEQFTPPGPVKANMGLPAPKHQVFLDMESQGDPHGGLTQQEPTRKPALETAPQKTVRLLNEASNKLLSMMEEMREAKGDPTWGNDTPLIDLIRDLTMHAETGVLAPDEYETVVIWLAQRSNKPPRLVRRILSSKLKVKKS